MNDGTAIADGVQSSCQPLVATSPATAAAAVASARRTAREADPARRDCVASSAARCAGSSRRETTSTALDASSTCTTGWPLYSGAIFTAVCWRLVVAPPMSSGSVIAAPLHLARDEHHLVERRRDESAQADQVGALVDGGLENPVGRHHDAEVDDLVVVAPEHHADDVLADVVDVALDRGQHDLAGRRAPRLVPALLLLHVRKEAGDRLLHRAGALDDLRQEHLAGAEQVADDAHAVHQRAFDHVERPRQRPTRLLDVLLDEVDDAVDEGVREPLLDAALAPGQVGALAAGASRRPSRQTAPAARWRRAAG